jgi:hypothetical protein
MIAETALFQKSHSRSLNGAVMMEGISKDAQT